MATKDGRLARGRTHAAQVIAGTLAELRTARQTANLSQAAVATRLGWSQTRYSKFERDVDPVTLEDICLAAAVLGLKASLELFRVDEGLRDAGSARLIGRFRELLSDAWLVIVEGPFPRLGDLRSWDVFARLKEGFRFGVEAETRIRDQQELVRRIRQRELHGGVDAILIVLSDSAHNRARLEELLQALGPQYRRPRHELLGALRSGSPLPGSGVILI